MNIPKFNFGVFGKINTGIAIALELKQYLKLWEDCKTLKPEFMACVEAVRAPFRNLLIEFRKKVASAEATAEATKNTTDDKVVAIIANAADKLMVLCHADDDYKRMTELDKLVE